MAIKNLSELLEKYKKGEIADAEAFESELNKVLPESWVPKATYNELNEKHKLADKQGKELASQLEELKGKAGLSDEYKAQIEKLTAEQKAAKDKFDLDMRTMRNDYALERALAGAKAKNVKAVKANLDLSKITFADDGKISGFDEQIDAIKKSDPYLFEEVKKEEPTRMPFFGGGMGSPNNGNGGAGEPGLFESMAAAAGLNVGKK